MFSSGQLLLFHLEESILLKTVLGCMGRPVRSKRPELGQQVQGEEQRVRKASVAQQMHQLGFLY